MAKGHDRYGTVIYRIDRDDHFVFVNDEFSSFSKENGAEKLTASAVLGKSIWDYVSQDETRHMHQVVLGRVRDLQRSLTLPFRCDSPGLRRFMEMALRPAPDLSVEYQCRTLKTEPRRPVSMLEPSHDTSDEMVRMCSWCKKMHIGEEIWVEVEEAIEKLGLLENDTPPQITHGMCPPCHESVTQQITSIR